MNARLQSRLASHSALRRASLALALASLGASASSTEDFAGKDATRPKAASISPAGIVECTEEIRRSRAQWKYWRGDAHAAIARLGLFQKDLFEGRCAGHPQARSYLDNADRLRERARSAAPPVPVAAPVATSVREP